MPTGSDGVSDVADWSPDDATAPSANPAGTRRARPQRDAFLAGEGDAWFSRNVDRLDSSYDGSSDPLAIEVRTVVETFEPHLRSSVSVLEIGCSGGWRLSWLKREAGVRVAGIDPSADAVAAASAKGIDARRASADELPFPNASFDIVVFGFCLYLCDRNDLFRIAAEAHRVTKDRAWIAILDFYDVGYSVRTYRHRNGVVSHKMDNSMMFSWHPDYTLYRHMVFHHETGSITDSSDDWVAISTLRRISQ